jgi:hypothetical protein
LFGEFTNGNFILKERKIMIKNYNRSTSTVFN